MSNWFVRVDISTSVFAHEHEKRSDAREVQDAIRVRLTDLIDSRNVVVIEEEE